ncbi:T9SS type B sorting domain-containing protein [Flavobacterium luteum]|uniref:T9SS type B sorting domain-containing protein n=1 Tax=Flavobacterium luteum TaxID=2026654 RepID=A0A7J5AJX6_9FLAO|nr:T9SS type B sorting domain-containing protein [Flavobacterium luteum]KAB1157912.1 T9SS type B sorting domain-containing protein [Flavobacterium luteum]
MQNFIKSFFFIFLTTLLSSVNFYSQNLLTNGNFGTYNAGVPSPSPLGYTSTHTQVPYNGASNPGIYAITNDPFILSPGSLVSTFDTTDGVIGNGTGNMMYVDGDKNKVFWKQDPPLLLDAFKIYTFTYWIKNVNQTVNGGAPPPTIKYNPVGCTSCATATYSTLLSKNWEKVTYQIIPTVSQLVSVELSTVNANSIGGHNFAIDDISLTPPILGLSVSTAQTNPSCPSTNDGTIIVYRNSGVASFTYNLTGTKTDSNNTGVFTGLGPGSYVVTVKDSDPLSPPPVVTPTINLIAPADMTLVSSAAGCVVPSSPVTLTASNGGATYNWTASTGVVIPSGSIANVSPAVNTTYTATSTRLPSVANPNLISNGDFESGNAGFFSDFVYTATSSNLSQFDYGVVSNPNSWDATFISSTDRSGIGKMFVTKGATKATNNIIWSQTVIPENNKTYTFAFYVQNAVATSPAQFKVLINGVQIGIAPLSASNAGSPGWTRISGTWNSALASTAKIQIINTNIALAGNDFAIDDISFTTATSKSCPLSKTVTVDVTPALSITNPSAVCTPSTVNITLPGVTAGSTGGGTLSYWSDAATTIALANPTAIATSGTYYIKSVSSICSDIKPVVVTINPAQVLSITNPAEICSPSTVNITLAAVTAGSAGGGVLSYWTNATATIALATPTAIATSGTYYIKSTSGICSDIKPVIVKITTTPVLNITNPSEVCSPATVDITLPAITAGTTGGGVLSYWTNASGTTALATPTAIATSGTYYIKSTSGICSDIKAVIIKITTTPVLSITNPAAVCSPATVDITLAAVTAGSIGGGTLSYWSDAAATIALATPTAIATSGTYYIKSISSICSDIKPVVVTINPAQVLNITNPSEVCSPATVDITLPAITAGTTGGGVLSYWTNASGTTALATPTAIATSGTYYIKSTSGICSDIKPVNVTVTAAPIAGTLSGNTNVCVALKTTFSSTSLGGVWSSSDTAIATIDADTGEITGVAAGNAIMTYTMLGTGGCVGVNDIETLAITVNAEPNAGTLSGIQDICVGSNTAFLTDSLEAGIWSSDDTNVATVNPANGDIVAGIPGIARITFTVSGSGVCTAATANRDVKVTGIPNPGTISGKTNICKDTTTVFTTDASDKTGTWSSSLILFATVDLNGEITGVTPGTSVITYTLPAVGGCNAVDASKSITIDPIVAPTFSTPFDSICANEALPKPLPITSNNGITGTWSPSLDTSNTTTLPIVKPYEFTPTAGLCASTFQSNVTILPLPIATATPPSDTVCSDVAPNITLSSSLPGTVTTFAWDVIPTEVIGDSSASGNKIDQKLTVTGFTSGKAVYTVIPSSGGCLGLPIEVTVNVNPAPEVNVTSNLKPSLCSGEVTDIQYDSKVAATTFSWTVVPKGVTGAFSSNGNAISQKIKTTGIVQGTVDYIITPISNTCTGPQETVTITVNPTPEIFGTTQSTKICSGETTNITLSPSIPGTQFNWTVLRTDVTGGKDSDISIDGIIKEPLIADAKVGIAKYTIIPTLNLCDGKPTDVTIQVNPLPKPVLENGIICVDQVTKTTFKSYTLDTGLSNTNHNFKWYFNDSPTPIPGANSRSFEVNVKGKYSVIATNKNTGCQSIKEEAEVFENLPATEDDIKVSVSDAFSENPIITVVVTGLGTGPFLYQLDDSAPQSSNVFNVPKSGEFKVTITDEQGCTNEFKKVIFIDYPKFFTPNGDGINDTWKIGALKNTKVDIYDRYGKLIKQIISSGAGWDGTLNGQLLPGTDYWFTVEYIEPNTEVKKLFKSHFSLKR